MIIPLEGFRYIFRIVVIGLSFGQAVVANTNEVTSKLVEYHTEDGEKVTGYLAFPITSGKFPAIILIHEWWGLNDDMKSKAQDFAEEGYVALAVDLYAGKSTTDPQEARLLAEVVRKNMAGAFGNLSSAADYLNNSPRVDTNRLASIGWCFGGGWSSQMAKNDLGVKVSVIYYGRFNPADDLTKMRTDIIGHFAEKDRVIEIESVKEFQVKLKSLKGDHHIYIYPNTTHGFASRKEANPNYAEAEAALAWRQTLAFLKTNL